MLLHGSAAVGDGVLRHLAYLPEYVDAAAEARMLAEVHNAPQGKWVQLSGRRLQNHGGIVARGGLVPAEMPRWLRDLCGRITADTCDLYGAGLQPNHVLVNAYAPGCGIMPHQDGPLYHPGVAILSLGSPAVLRFWRKQEEGGTGGLPPVASVLLMPRSLLLFSDEAYEDCLHGIDEVLSEVIDASVINPEAAGQQHCRLAASCHCKQEQEQQEKQLQQQQMQQQPPPQQPPQQQQQPPLQKLCELGLSQRSDNVDVLLPRCGERVSLTIRRVLKEHRALSLLRR